MCQADISVVTAKEGGVKRRRGECSRLSSVAGGEGELAGNSITEAVVTTLPEIPNEIIIPPLSKQVVTVFGSYNTNTAAAAKQLCGWNLVSCENRISLIILSTSH
ncbi:hypothetical protein NPIL_563341 [Nephila pilipes]|uniref:Uncharacterized protein n=1 Tax=Nephila pilipes TaxID=299642 RepID=A0A8X6IM88_NEPPI|nr:hypothetical protein NPIL_563341 [Nephila pilipes]